jgi:hypothetical protein
MTSLLRSLVISISAGVILYLIFPFLPAGARRFYMAIAASILFFAMGLLFKKGR